MIYLATVVVIFLSIILQSTVFKALALADVVPNLLLVVTVSMAYIRGRKFGIFTGFLSGLLYDILFGSLIGLNAFLYMLVGYLIGYCNRIYYQNDFTFSLFLVGISDLFYNFLFYLFEFLLRSKLDLGNYFRSVMIPELIYTLLAGVVLYHALNAMNNFLLRFEYKEE
ncbi:rod shape-determining protein MreD [Anaerolentibacter hominis]|uniref:rod shape-determining protein MreD n=1 Tax=Anaerolentibacter hominis TaxID=3079009 RepID=UPI0031B88BD0